jgi:DNA-binding FadR family transcriptional regulator
MPMPQAYQRSGGSVPLQTVEPMRLYRQIAGQIESLIDSGEFPPGSRLPPERELAVLLGVSRTSVREAIIALEIAGRVDVRVGTGIFVTSPRTQRSGDAGADRDDGPGPFELLAARAIVEGEFAAVAARTATKENIAALRETIATMRTHDDDFQGRDTADRAFHVLIAEATGNDALPPITGMLWDQRRGGLWTRIERHFHTPALRVRTLADHEAIVAAIAAHDSDAARTAMHRHLNRVAREFQRRIDEAPAPTGGPQSKGAKAAAARGSSRSLT